MAASSQITTRKRVLLVENESTVLQFLVEALQTTPWEVGLAEDGLEGFLKFQEGGWDVVITDKGMPTMDGEKMAAEIKAISPRTPIVMISGLTDEIRDPSIYCAVLQKPFEVMELIHAVELGCAFAPRIPEEA